MAGTARSERKARSGEKDRGVERRGEEGRREDSRGHIKEKNNLSRLASIAVSGVEEAGQ